MIVIIGESGAGKSSVAKELEKYGFETVVSYTTRPPRPGERDGVDYYFISDNEYEALNKNGRLIAKGDYRGWKYGVGVNKLKENSVAVLTPAGLRELKRVGPTIMPKITDGHNIDGLELPKIYSVYLDIPRRDRLIKLLERGDDIEECYRRSLSDVGQFDGVSDEVDVVIKNAGYKFSQGTLAEEIIIWLRAVTGRNW